MALKFSMFLHNYIYAVGDVNVLGFVGTWKFIEFFQI